MDKPLVPSSVQCLTEAFRDMGAVTARVFEHIDACEGCKDCLYLREAIQAALSEATVSPTEVAFP